MGKPHRPSLSAVLGAKSTSESTPVSPSPSPSGRLRIGRRAAGHAQLNVLVPVDLRRKAKIKALEQGRDLSDVVAELLNRWLDE